MASIHPGVHPLKMFQCALGMQYLHGVSTRSWFPCYSLRYWYLIPLCRFQRGLVHGGLKPSNILIAENGQICVADYGLIGLMPSENICAHRYFSPEAWKGVCL